MENPMKMTRSSEEENRAEKKMGRGRGRCECVVRSKQEEYRQLADLTGFDNLKSMLETEALIRSRKGNKSKKKKQKKNRDADFMFQAQELVLVDNAMDEGQESKDRGVETVASLKSESAQATEKDTPQKPVVDVAMEKDPANVTVEMTKTSPAANHVNSAVAISCSVFSSEGDGVTSSMSFCGGATEMRPAESFIVKEMKQKSRKEDVYSPKEEQQAETGKGMVTEPVERAPRYFDPPSNSWDRCFNCGQEGHLRRECLIGKWKKRCFLCGSLDHNGRHCTQNQYCFICKGIGHLSNHCLENGPKKKLNLNICLRCGDAGHDMFACQNEYSPDDLKEIQCYVCKNFGHLCCGDFLDIGPRELSCYNCGQSGHLGYSCGATSCSNASTTGYIDEERKAILQEAAPSTGRVDR